MSTTTIRLPEDLRARLARVAQAKGSTAHAMILNAIADHVDAEERRQDFYATAEQRYVEILETDETIPWEKMKTYLQARASGAAVRKPQSRKLAR